MADPIALLRPRFQAALAAAFGPELADTDPMLRPSKLADYQANVALSLTKKVGKPPRQIAEALVAHLDLADACDKIEIAGPGYVNLTLKGSFLADEVARAGADARLGVPRAAGPEIVVIDYSAPNVAKEMHVGHLRSTIIGDALARALEFVGHRVIRQNHIGDWGTPFGMLIEHLVDLGEASEDTALSVGDLNAFYRQAREKFDADPAFKERSRKRVVLLQSGDETTRVLWRKLVDESKRYFAAVYQRLGVTLRDEDVCSESFYNPMLPDVVAELEQKGLATMSEGALCVFPPGFTGPDDAPLIIRKQDGGYGYATTDLAAIRYRTQTLHATRLLYEVAAQQSRHLAMIYATAKAAGWLVLPAHAEHVAHGSVLGADKKMFKTRSGESVRLVDLLDEAVERASAAVLQKNPDLDAATRADVARMIGIGAVKYADLSSDRIKDYVFDWDRMLAFEGNTAPYLQYAHARIRSIFRRGDIGASAQAAPIHIDEPAEKALAMALLGFGAAVHAVCDTLQPHRLCTYLFELGTVFTSFYEQCPVLKAPSDEQRLSRLHLCDLTARVLAKGLDLLGIEAPARM